MKKNFAQTKGILTSVIRGKLDQPTMVKVQYSVDDTDYIVKEPLRYKNEFLKLGFFIKTPKIPITPGTTLIITYNQDNPKEAYIQENKKYKH